ncbi:MAG: Rieske (2Fe-2S) protein [Acidimicrobiales bacterium]
MPDVEDVGALEDLPDGGVVGVVAHGYRVALFRRGPRVYGLWARCPHAGGPLDEGYVTAAGDVMCPWHGWRFQVESGLPATRAFQHGTPAEEPVAAFPVEVVGGRVQVGPPPPGIEPPPLLLF